MALKKIKFHINRHMLLVVLAAAMVRLRVTLAMQVTGTAARLSQATGVVLTQVQVLAIVPTIIAYAR